MQLQLNKWSTWLGRHILHHKYFYLKFTIWHPIFKINFFLLFTLKNEPPLFSFIDKNLAYLLWFLHLRTISLQDSHKRIKRRDKFLQTHFNYSFFLFIDHKIRRGDGETFNLNQGKNLIFAYEELDLKFEMILFKEGVLLLHFRMKV